ncbi:PREDICTED: putative F-box/LRR-repeat protein 9 [Camelina sativa]|uniref:F-box/LRR-repeat protein 9 n=1 Tax=Camelina sativa TaxID=90675 RepID=A0ABM0T8E1_CAMSA|nr:PREDICTED: putative F-box/LRR-repeat protein 9 [Camelina sativa]
MASLTPPSPPAMKNGEFRRNWAELPPEMTLSILIRLSPIELLQNAQRVCRSWRRVCVDPSMWRKIDLRNLDGLVYDLETMCRHAVDLSQGGLLEINIDHYTTTSLLTYIAERSSDLRSLGFVECGPVVSRGVIEAVMKLPMLEELDISYDSIREQDLILVGQSCPSLRTLKLNCAGNSEYCCDKVALAIAETMPCLRHLRLFRNGLSDTGLNAILECCPHLKVLELHKCSNITLVGNMGN